MVYRYWFFNHGFKNEDSTFNSSHDLVMLCLNISNIAVIMLKLLIIVVLLLTLANLKQFIH